MNDFEAATCRVGHKLTGLVNLIKYVAFRKRNDHKSQLRARIAIAFYRRVAGFPQLDENVDAKESPTSSESNPDDEDNCGLCLLPAEIYQLIIDHVTDFDYKTRQRTLVALLSSCKALQVLAEPYLYAHPRDLETVERQWQFSFTLAVEPHLANLVQSLQVLWLPTGENSKLLIDIARACSNTKELVIQRGESLEDPNQILKEDLLNMAALLDASSHTTSLWYSTFVKWTPEEERYGDTAKEEIFSLGLEDGRFAKFARQLAKLTFHGQVQWLLRALLPHLSTNFKSLTLGQETSLDFSPNLFSNLSLHSPCLQDLEVRCTITSSTDLVEACKTWGTTLRILRVSSIEGVPDWIPQVMPFMEALQELSLGPGCYTSIRDLDAIARSPRPQRFASLSFGDLQDPEDAIDVDTARAQLNDSLVRLIHSHSSTLRNLDLNTGRLQVGRTVLRSCRQAKRLESLYVAPPVDIKCSDLDDLLNACVKLADMPVRLVKSSLHPREWEERIEARERQEEEEFSRDVACQGLRS